MQKLQCELCGSVDIIRTDDGFFRCEHCGCKYTLEPAKAVCQNERRVHHEHNMHACGMKVHTVEHGKVVPCGHKQGYGSSRQA